MDRGIRQQRTTSRKANAQGLIEFALITPVLLLIIFAIIDFGWMVFNYAQLYNATREGARYGSVVGFTGGLPQYKQCDKIKGRVKELAGFSGVGNNPNDITIIYDDGREKDQPGAAGIRFDVDSWIAAAGTSPIPSSVQYKVMTAYCSTNATDTDPSGNTFTLASWHQGNEDLLDPPQTASGLRANNKLNNADRIVVFVNVNVQFLTPLIRTFAKGGMTMKFSVGRTLFPGGIALSPGS